MQTVAISSGDNREERALKALRSAPGSFWDKINSAKTILVSPELGHHLDHAAAIHVDVLRGILRAIRKHTSAPIVIAGASERSTLSAFQNFGYETLVQTFSQVSLCDVNSVEGSAVDEGGRVRVPREVLSADVRLYVTKTGSWELQNWQPNTQHTGSGLCWLRESCQDASLIACAREKISQAILPDLVMNVQSG